MINVFNTPFEIGLRAELLLYTVSPNGLTIDRIAAYDFITVYAKNFNLSDFSLHGDNNFNFSEFSTRRVIFKTALKNLALDGTVKVECASNGFIYKLNQEGIKLVENMASDYSSEYLRIAKKTHQTYRNKSDASLISDINELALKTLRR